MLLLFFALGTAHTAVNVRELPWKVVKRWEQLTDTNHAKHSFLAVEAAGYVGLWLLAGAPHLPVVLSMSMSGVLNKIMSTQIQVNNEHI